MGGVVYVTLVDKSSLEDWPSLMPRMRQGGTCGVGWGLAPPHKETACGLRFREGRQTPPEPRTCLQSGIEMDLQRASLPKPIRTKAPPHSLPSFPALSLPVLPGQEKCRWGLLPLKKTGLLGLLDCMWGHSLLALSGSSSLRTSLVAISKGLRKCRECVGVVFSGKKQVLGQERGVQSPDSGQE